MTNKYIGGETVANTKGKTKSGTTANKKSNSKSASGTKSATKSGKKRSGRKTSKKNSELRIEVISLLLIALTMLLLFSNFGLCGKAGRVLSAFMFGGFGFPAYILPILIFVGIFILMANTGNRKIILKVILSFVLYLLICTFFYLVLNGSDETYNLKEIYKQCYTDRTGGGVVGACIGHAISLVFGIIGAYIVTVIGAIICLVVITEKSFINGVKQYGSNAVSNVREDYETLKENSEAAREERERKKEQRRLREAKHVRGVANVSLSGEEHGNMHEVTGEKINPVDDASDKVIFRGHIDIDSADVLETEKAGISSDVDKNEPFTPKEKIEVSDDAKKVMNRAPYGSRSTDKKEGSGDDDVTEEIKTRTRKAYTRKYMSPPTSLLTKNEAVKGTTKAELQETADRLVQTLKIYGVDVTLKEVSKGPTVTRYELLPAVGTKISKITSLSDEIKMNMAVSDIRIEAPIPGKQAVGIEIPNGANEMVHIRELIESPELKNNPSKLAFAAGKDLSGKVIVADIAKMPHMLVAGTTGSGKSVFTNSIIMTILYRATPEEVRMIIIDPKVVEFGVYNGIPHLLIPVVTDAKKAATALNWAVAEMSERYKKFASLNVKELKSYNQKVESMEVKEGEERPEKLPQILIIIDELADLMMVASKEVESAICRLAQLARAAGIHLVIATQRPSVDVVTGLIKANIPSRVALLVSSGTDSRTIIGTNGAEKLLGNGDMLFFPSGYVKAVRVQGAYVSDTEVQKTVEFLSKRSGEIVYDEEVVKKISESSQEGNGNGGNERDDYFEEAGRFVIEKDKASTSMLQRVFRVGFNRAARIIDQLNEAGVVGDEEGTKPRKVLMTMEEFEDYLNNT